MTDKKNKKKPKYKKNEISYCLRCIKSTRVKEIHEVLTLVNLIPQQSSKCKIWNARKSVILKEYKPNRKQKYFHKLQKHVKSLFSL